MFPKLFLITAIFLLCISKISAEGFNDIGSKDNSLVWAVGDNGNIIRSNNGGLNWSRYSLGNINYHCIYMKGQFIWIGGDNGIFQVSTNNGISFSQSTLGSGNKLSSIYFYNNLSGWIAGDNGMILRTTNGGLNWITLNSNTSQNLNSIKFYNGVNGAACGNNGTVVLSTNSGDNWSVSPVPVNSDLLSIDIVSSFIISCGKNSTTIRSTNSGSTWSNIISNFAIESDINSVFMVSSTNVYTVGGGGFIRNSTNGGQTFTFQSNPLFNDLKKIYFNSPAVGWCISKSSDIVIRTINTGNDWNLPNGASQSFTWSLKLPLVFYTSSGNVFATNPYNKEEIFVTKSNAIFRSLNRGDNWTQISTTPFPLNSCSNALLVSPKDTNKFLVAIDSSFTFFGKVFRSTNYGQTWNTTFSGERNSDGCPMEMDPNHPDTVYYAPSDSFLYRSTNFGLTWSQVGTKRFSDICIVEVLEGNSNIILVGDASDHGTLYRSTDYGSSWTDVNDTLSFEIPDIANSKTDPLTVYCAFYEGIGGLKRSTNQGINWTNVNIDYRAWAVDIARDDPNVYAYGTWTNNPIYITTNAGVTFFPTSNLAGGTFALFYYDRSTLIAQMTEGYYKLKVTSSVPIGINQTSSVIPDEFMLQQNYPNPFNPVTRIKFQIPSDVKRQRSKVKLIIYDALGKEAATLVNENLSPGSYEVEFSGNNFPSGVYFYKLSASESSVVKRMILLK